MKFLQRNNEQIHLFKHMCLYDEWNQMHTGIKIKLHKRQNKQ